jgi:hypothetical protein
MTQLSRATRFRAVLGSAICAATLIALLPAAAAEAPAGHFDVRSAVASLTDKPVSDQQQILNQMTPSQQVQVAKALRPVAKQVDVLDTAGRVVASTGRLAVDAPVDANALGAHGDIPQVGAPTGATADGATGIDFRERLYGIFENVVVQYDSVVYWSWTNVPPATRVYNHYAVGSAHYLFWEFDGNRIDQVTAVPAFAAQQVVASGKFCYKVGFSFFSGCLQNWDPTIDATVYIGGGYYAFDPTSTPY